MCRVRPPDIRATCIACQSTRLARTVSDDARTTCAGCRRAVRSRPVADLACRLEIRTLSFVDRRLTRPRQPALSSAYQPAVNREDRISALKQDDGVEQRLEQLERRLAATIRVVNENESHLGRLEVTHPRRRPVPALPPIPLRPRATVAPSARLPADAASGYFIEPFELGICDVLVGPVIAAIMFGEPGMTTEWCTCLHHT
jgi:hypothetical protein